MPASPSVPDRPAAKHEGPRYTRFAPRAPSAGAGALILLAVALISGLLAFPRLLYSPDRGSVAALLFLFLVPSLAAGFLTAGMASALGGRMSLRRSLLLASVAQGIVFVFLLVWRGLSFIPGLGLPGAFAVILSAQSLVLWLRYMSLFGISRPSVGRSLPPALLQPGLVVVGALLLGLFPLLLLGSILLLALGFGAAVLVIRGADRPLRREFDASGVDLIRPMLDHVAYRDPEATTTLEKFFARHAVPARVNAQAVVFRAEDRTVATLALPTVHPGPFAALGSSDLPQHLAHALEPAAGVLLVPHTPCNHDLDLPTATERGKLIEATRKLLDGMTPVPGEVPVTPLLEPHPGSLVRMQRLGGVLLAIVSQAPEPTDDIDFAVADNLRNRVSDPSLTIGLIDAHNSYRPPEGNLSYGSPRHRELVADFDAAWKLTQARTAPSPIRAGVAVLSGYKIGEHGIGPTGIRALVIEAGGTRTAYVLLDGNNLVLGLRAAILERLKDLVDAAEVMTTDNHVVHEVDGGVNPVGERIPLARLSGDIRRAVETALGNLTPVGVGGATKELPEILVLGPGWTGRLLTSLGDTLSMFANLSLATFLFLIASSTVLLAVVR